MPAWVATAAAAAPRLLRWRCRRLAAACPVRLVGDIRHATAVFHKVFGQENKPGAPVTSSQGARDTYVGVRKRASGWFVGWRAAAPFEPSLTRHACDTAVEGHSSHFMFPATCMRHACALTGTCQSCTQVRLLCLLRANHS